MGDQGSILAGEGVAGRMAPIAFSSSRGPPPGLGFEPITQDTSPEHRMFGQGANRPPAATTGKATMWAHEPSNGGAQLMQEPPQTGTYTGTIGAGMQGAAPAPQAVTELASKPHPPGTEDSSHKGGQLDIQESGGT
jgi:hypothetical protein